MGRGLPAWLTGLAHRGLQRGIPCALATTPAEREAIARLRYEVQRGEQNAEIGEVDHERRRAWYPEDDHPDTMHFYAGEPGDLRGCARVRVWRPGRVPPAEWAHFSMDLLPGVSELTVCEVAKLAVVPRLRGSMAMAALSGFSLHRTVSTWGNEVMFAACVPGLVRAYRKLGLRTFGGRLLSTAWGVAVPLVGITHDVEHVRRAGSPWYPPLRRLAREGRLPPDAPAIREQAVRDRSIVTEPAEVKTELVAFAAAGASPFLRGLTPEAIEALARHGVIFDVPAGVTLIRRGNVATEVFLVLSGEFQALRQDRQLLPLGSGEIFGEIAVLRQGGQRAADVVALTPGRVLMIRRSLLKNLSAADPATALVIYRALTEELIRKLIL